MQHLATKVSASNETLQPSHISSGTHATITSLEMEKYFSNNSATKSITKVSDKYSCTCCDYITSYKSNWKKHIQTEKHFSNRAAQSIGKVSENYDCSMCGKVYKDRTGLWRHKKCCAKSFNMEYNIEHDSADVKTQAEISQMTTLFIESVKQNQEILLQNQEFQQKMFELMKDSNGIVNNNSHNTINNKFNLNVFLNETCKDAMNLSEFVDSLKITLTDLENVGKLGYTEGISRIFTNGLKELEIHKRPIHCSDLKRETVYVKNDNKWEKENNHLKKAIKQITNKNIRLIPTWKEQNPGHQHYHNKKNDEYLKIMYESMGPTDKLEEDKYFSKIITNLAKETIIVKIQ